MYVAKTMKFELEEEKYRGKSTYCWLPFADLLSLHDSVSDMAYNLKETKYKFEFKPQLKHKNRSFKYSNCFTGKMSTYQKV